MRKAFTYTYRFLPTALQNESDLRLPICNGLCNLIEKNKAIIENSQTMNDGNSDLSGYRY